MELKDKAEKATPGPWNVDSLGNIFRTPHAKDEDYQPVVLLTKSSLDEYAPTEADAAYIAAANPQVVLAMIELLQDDIFPAYELADEVRLLKIENERLSKEAAWLAEQVLPRCPGLCSHGENTDHEVCITCWREAARQTIKDE